MARRDRGRLERELFDLRTQLSQSAAASDLEEARRNKEKAERQRQQLQDQVSALVTSPSLCDWTKRTMPPVTCFSSNHKAFANPGFLLVRCRMTNLQDGKFFSPLFCSQLLTISRDLEKKERSLSQMIDDLRAAQLRAEAAERSLSEATAREDAAVRELREARRREEALEERSGRQLRQLAELEASREQAASSAEEDLKE